MFGPMQASSLGDGSSGKRADARRAAAAFEGRDAGTRFDGAAVGGPPRSTGVRIGASLAGGRTSPHTARFDGIAIEPVSPAGGHAHREMPPSPYGHKKKATDLYVCRLRSGTTKT